MEKLSIAELKNSLRTEKFGRNIVFFETTQSTQDEARKLLQGNAPEGTVVLAESQMKGRGRSGKSWFSPPGAGLWSSIILFPGGHCSANVISLTCALAIASVIRKLTGLGSAVKWPNDVLVGGKKIAGVLVENAGGKLILGAGINVNLDEEEIPVNIKHSATSILNETGKEISRLLLMREYLQEFETLYLKLCDEGFSAVREELKKISILLGRQVIASFNRREFYGEAIDIDMDGALIVRLDSGMQKRFVAGEVRLYEKGKE